MQLALSAEVGFGFCWVRVLCVCGLFYFLLTSDSRAVTRATCHVAVAALSSDRFGVGFYYSSKTQAPI